MTLALRTAIYIITERCRWTVYFRVTGRVLKIQIIQGWQRGDSVLAAKVCTGPHNRLLRRQHCSSLCSQSEGHEHVADIASALGHIFVGFLAVFGRHNICPPHFASKVSYSASPQTFAESSRSAPCRCTASALLFGLKLCGFFLDFEHPTFQSAKRSALKGQPVLSPGQRPGYQRINAYAL